MTEAEITAAGIAKAKNNEEESKRLAAEDEEVLQVAKRKGYKIFLYGQNFINTLPRL